jgi:hypothetical protein
MNVDFNYRFQLRKPFRPPLIDSDCEIFSAFQLSISIANNFPLPKKLKKKIGKKIQSSAVQKVVNDCLAARIKNQISV